MLCVLIVYLNVKLSVFKGVRVSGVRISLPGYVIKYLQVYLLVSNYACQRVCICSYVQKMKDKEKKSSVLPVRYLSSIRYYKDRLIGSS